MQKWEYKIFASHLDPADVMTIMDASGSEGWELVSVVAVTDHLPLALLEPNDEQANELVQLQAFRYIFKRQAV